MKIAICDDDVKVINEISKTLKRVTREKEMVIPTVMRFASSQELLDYYKNKPFETFSFNCLSSCPVPINMSTD